jgi:hypothetical protein
MENLIKNIPRVIAALGLIAMSFGVVVLTQYYATAQQPATPPAASCTDVFQPCIEAGGEFAIPIVQKAANQCVPSSARSCVDIVYASSSVVVLTGETIPQVQVNLRSDNHMIWQAMNQIKAQGYNVQSVAITGSGLEANPYQYTVVMTK